jgi:hypothetical protein
VLIFDVLSLLVVEVLFLLLHPARANNAVTDNADVKTIFLNFILYLLKRFLMLL